MDRRRRALAFALVVTLGFTEGCRSLQPARPSELAPEQWIGVRSAREIALTVVPVDGSAPGAPCAARLFEGRLRAVAGDTLHLRALTNVVFGVDAPAHCFAGAAGYFLLSENSDAVVSVARRDAHRTRFFVVAAVIFVGALVMSFITADWTYSDNSSLRGPHGQHSPSLLDHAAA